MMLKDRLEHRFTAIIPDRLEPGILYVSMEYATGAHSCCCGCGEEVITPFTPTDWRMEFDGETISLSPSVGSWTLPCRSHYIIKRGKVIEAGRWSDEAVEAERRRDRASKARFYGDRSATPIPAHSPNHAPSPPAAPERRGFVDRIKHWLGLP